MWNDENVSSRQAVAQGLADLCVFTGLNDSYGVSVTKQPDEKGKVYWATTFCRAALVDGVIKTYSPNFIAISWQTQYRDMPATGNEVFRSEQAAKQFILTNFSRL